MGIFLWTGECISMKITGRAILSLFPLICTYDGEFVLVLVKHFLWKTKARPFQVWFEMCKKVCNWPESSISQYVEELRHGQSPDTNTQWIVLGPGITLNLHTNSLRLRLGPGLTRNLHLSRYVASKLWSWTIYKSEYFVYCDLPEIPSQGSWDHVSPLYQQIEIFTLRSKFLEKH